MNWTVRPFGSERTRRNQIWSHRGTLSRTRWDGHTELQNAAAKFLEVDSRFPLSCSRIHGKRKWFHKKIPSMCAHLVVEPNPAAQWSTSQGDAAMKQIWFIICEWGEPEEQISAGLWRTESNGWKTRSSPQPSEEQSSSVRTLEPGLTAFLLILFGLEVLFYTGTNEVTEKWNGRTLWDIGADLKVKVGHGEDKRFQENSCYHQQ